MDTYANLFRGQEAEAVAKMRDMIAAASNQTEVMQATGPEDLAVASSEAAQHIQQYPARETYTKRDKRLQRLAPTQLHPLS
jgi:creatinine amidohydrolase/Fe(II)-dependent formamide hydrolase-like protein